MSMAELLAIEVSSAMVVAASRYMDTCTYITFTTATTTAVLLWHIDCSMEAATAAAAATIECNLQLLPTGSSEIGIQLYKCQTTVLQKLLLCDAQKLSDV